MNTIKALKTILFLVISLYTFSQDYETISIPRVKGPITLDGLSNEEAWKGIIPFNPVMQSPVFGVEASEKTDILLAYNDDYLYVAGRLYDKEPDKILGTSYKRDAGNASSEWFGVALDTYNDKENAMAFFTTPTGLRWDANVVEGPGGVTISANWNTFWDVATTQNEDGWFAEFRIPFSSLRFQSKDGEVTMGLISFRLIGRKNEKDIFPTIPNNWPKSFYKISRAQAINFHNITNKNPLYVAPYVLADREEINKLAKEQDTYQKKIHIKYEVGIDAKYSITSNLTLDATINTDFSQVELDDQIISLDRFSIYMPEKRQFFLERSSNFDFTFNRSNQVFYSRKIGIQDGKLARIYGGGRVVGRIGNTDIGFLNMQTEAIDTFPSENLGVIRLKQQIINENSFIGGITTTRLGVDGSYNVVYGLDGIFQIRNDDYLKIMAVQSQENNIAESVFSNNSLRYQIEMERRSNAGFNYLFGTGYAGKNYHPGLGFEEWKNYQLYVAKLEYSWFAAESSPIFRTYINIWPYAYFSNSHNNYDIINPNLTISTSTKPGYKYTLIGFCTYENIRDSVTFLDQINIPEGHYKYFHANAKFNTPHAFPFKTTIELNIGQFYDGFKNSLIVQSTWNASRFLELEGTYQYDRIEIPDRNQKAESHLFRFKALFMLNTKLSLAAFMQYSNIEKLSISNVRFRYNPGEGNDLYIVYSHGINTNRTELSPLPPVTNGWNINVKYVNTFIF